MRILGLHHVTAMAADLDANLRFYRDELGLRLVKRTVNFDDPSSPHIYYGDETGSPGSLVTFFIIRGLPQGRVGWPQVGGLRLEGISRGGPDPDGMPIEQATSASPPAPARLATHTLLLPSEERIERTRRFVEEFLPGLPEGTLRYEVGDRGRPGAGTIHHIAFRIGTDAEQLDLQAKLHEAGVNVSPVMERIYFRSIYFREPGGILLEVATDGPGMTVDEPVERLGEELRLPPWMPGGTGLDG